MFLLKKEKKNRLSNDDDDIFINDAYILAVIMKPEDNTNTLRRYHNRYHNPNFKRLSTKDYNLAFCSIAKQLERGSCVDFFSIQRIVI